MRRPMPRLPQLMFSYGLTGACQFQTLFGTLVFHEIQCTESSAIISSFGRVPKQLKPEQQAMRMMTSLDNLQRYKTEGEAMLERIVTGEETWIHHYQPETKQASRQWKHKESPTLTKFKIVPSVSKVMATVFWDMRGVLLVEFQEHGRTVNCHTAVCWSDSKLRYEQNKGLLTQGVILLHDNA